MDYVLWVVMIHKASLCSNIMKNRIIVKTSSMNLRCCYCWVFLPITEQWLAFALLIWKQKRVYRCYSPSALNFTSHIGPPGVGNWACVSNIQIIMIVFRISIIMKNNVYEKMSCSENMLVIRLIHQSLSYLLSAAIFTVQLVNLLYKLPALFMRKVR